ncbi:MAG TPA: hypothetical protein VLG47_06035 [Candidatus Saccharimonadales bacterium]|nr:hypothetical protein [Candidatus Saccharimonadales bacterium]
MNPMQNSIPRHKSLRNTLATPAILNVTSVTPAVSVIAVAPRRDLCHRKRDLQWVHIKLRYTK